MNTRFVQCAGWLIVGLTVLPLIGAAADAQLQEAPLPSRLDWLLTSHDVHYGLHVRASSSDCLHAEAERGR